MKRISLFAAVTTLRDNSSCTVFLVKTAHSEISKIAEKGREGRDFNNLQRSQAADQLRIRL